MLVRFRPTITALLLVLVTLTGCGRDNKSAAAQSGVFRWAAFPIELQVEDSIYHDAQSMADLSDAVAFWEDQAGKPLFQVRNSSWPAGQKPFTGDPQDPDEITANVIMFQNPWPFDSNVAGQSILHAEQNITQHAVMLLNPHTNLCHADCYGTFQDTSLRKLFAHELGHFLGFNHTDDINDIMYPEIQKGGSLHGVQINNGILVQLVH